MKKNDGDKTYAFDFRGGPKNGLTIETNGQLVLRLAIIEELTLAEELKLSLEIAANTVVALPDRLYRVARYRRGFGEYTFEGYE